MGTEVKKALDKIGHSPMLTLDANVIQEYWKNRPKASVVREILELGKAGKVQLAVTGRIHEDIPDDPLAALINQLPDIGVVEKPAVARWDYFTWA